MYRGEYTLIGHESSFFSRKLEAQLRFQRLPWRWQFKKQESAAQIEARAGTHFIPVLQTPDNWMIHDTISIGPMLSARHAEYAVIPESPLQRASAFILEDFFNHWLGRSCVHSRWCYPDNVAWAGQRFASNLLFGRSITEPLSEQELQQASEFGTMMYENFGKNVCDYIGVPAEQAEAVQGDFKLMLEALDKHLENNDFLLGPRPCPADFALAGAAKAHYILDPEPLSWLGKYEGMLTGYTESFYGEEPIPRASWLPDDQVPDTLGVLLDYLQRSYLQFATANIAAGKAGEKYYEYDYGFGATRARTQRRLNKARLHVQDELNRVDAANNESITELYGSRGILQHYLSD
ncbi:MAG: glutathione binding-like protein [Halioglobus sp.]|nr:glutathione binding-like protein [Halioglobus sp.]